MLALYIQGSLIDHAWHVHQCTHRSGSYTVLSGTGLGNDTLLAHLLGQQNLTDGVVNLVCSSMVQVLTFQIQLTAILLAHSAGIVQR